LEILDKFNHNFQIPIESAKLHNDNVTLHKLVEQEGLLVCINTIFLQRTDTYDTIFPQIYLMNCDDSAIQDIKDGTFASNQTLVKLAHAYLQARGIK
jgi:hypothetical protein